MFALVIILLVTVAACQHAPAPKSLEVKATAKNCGKAFVLEHSDLYAENIRLKQALEICRKR